MNSRCIEPSGTRCHFGKPPVFIRPRTWAPIFFFFSFFFLSDPCTLAHTQGSPESLRFRFKQCAFCPSLRFPTEILSLSTEFSFFPFLFSSNNTRYNICSPIFVKFHRIIRSSLSLSSISMKYLYYVNLCAIKFFLLHSRVATRNWVTF